MTDLTLLQQKVTALLQNIEYRLEEPLSKHTSFKIGGGAEVMVFPKSTQELSETLKAAKLLKVQPVVLGAGTNILAPDEGIRGMVICLKDCLDGMEQLDETTIRVMSGVTMTRGALYAANLGLSGLEFAHGIPGTVGGGVYMNAGAYGGEICQVCTNVAVMDFDGNITERTNAEMEFSYRHSYLEENPGIVVYADFLLNKSPVEEIKGKMQELMAKRKNSQPLDMPSAGSTFKRPVGGYAAALIDETGLKGFAVGGAQVSTKHAGFVVNAGGATASDVLNLVQQVSDKVYDRTGILLEPEVRIW